MLDETWPLEFLEVPLAAVGWSVATFPVWDGALEPATAPGWLASLEAFVPSAGPAEKVAASPTVLGVENGIGVEMFGKGPDMKAVTLRF